MVFTCACPPRQTERMRYRHAGCLRRAARIALTENDVSRCALLVLGFAMILDVGCAPPAGRDVRPLPPFFVSTGMIEKHASDPSRDHHGADSPERRPPPAQVCGPGAASSPSLARSVLTAPSVPTTAPTSRAGPAGSQPTPHTITLPGITVDLHTRELRIDGRVCIEQGILEYLAVAAGGKEYESVFSLNCRPSQLAAAMVIAGYEAGDLPLELRGDFVPGTEPAASQPDAGPNITSLPAEPAPTMRSQPTRVTVAVDVLCADDSWQRRPIESFLIDRRTDRPPDRLVWAFTGSFFHRDQAMPLEYFVADVEKSVIALWYDPTALLNLTQNVGNPYRSAAAGLQVNPAALPPRGTRVRLVLEPAVTPAAG